MPPANHFGMVGRTKAAGFIAPVPVIAILQSLFCFNLHEQSKVGNGFAKAE
jgi:hypothetical protein